MTIILDGTAGIANNATDLSYTGTLTGSTGVVNIGSGQIYKDASGNLGLGTIPATYWVGTKAVSLGLSASFYGDGQSFNWPAGVLTNGARTGASTFVYTAPTAVAIPAYRYEMGNGVGGHAWFYAPTGAQGSAISYTQAMTLDASGNLLIGAATSTAKLNLVPDSTYNLCIRSNPLASVVPYTFAIFNNTSTASGSIVVNSTTTAYNTSSDYRLKNTVAPMQGALDKVALLKPCTYKWNVDNSDGQGFIAHELAEIEPGCVSGEKDAVDAEGKPQYQGIDTSFLVATLTAAIQELKAIIDMQATRITALEAK